MTRQIVLDHIVFEIRQRPVGQGIEAEPPFEKLDGLHRGAFFGLESLAPGNLGRKPFQRALQRHHLAKTAAGIGAARPQCAVGIAGCTLDRMRCQRTQIAKPELFLQTVAIAQRFAE